MGARWVDSLLKLSVSLEQQQPIRQPNEDTPLPTNRL